MSENTSIVVPEQLRLTPKEMEKVKKHLPDYIKALKTRPWWPIAGPQIIAMQSQADVTLFGGSAGGSKSSTLIGLALTQHQNSILFRRESTQLTGIKDHIAELLGNRDGYSGQQQRWLTPDGRVIDMGSVPNEGDVERYQGRPHDLIGFDELCHFSESQFRFLCGWNRTTIRGQRCRIFCTANPPTSSEGYWVIRYWAPWLDKNHPKPAESGEIRYFASVDGEDIEVEDASSFEHNGEIIKPQSRTFIQSKLADNPYLMQTNYMQTLQALPEPLRSQMLFGDWNAGREDVELQTIPSEWVEQAMERWRPRDVKGAMSVLACDPSRGGRDETVLSARHKWWFDKLKVYPGHEITTGGAAASRILDYIDGYDPVVAVDTIGVGASCFDHLQPYIGSYAIPFNSSEKPSINSDSTGALKFLNKRAEAWWRLREMLDPQTGLNLQLPPDERLKADLCAPMYEITARGLQIESKDQIKKRIGRSPDRGDAVVMCAATRNIIRRNR